MIRRSALLILLTATLSGCAYFGSGFMVDQLNKAQPNGPAFTQELTTQYKNRANQSQYESLNYEQAYRNADRGLDASVGAVVQPYSTGEFDIPESMLPEIAKARIDLDKALNEGARETTPREAALAQAKYDCWVEDAAKTWLPDLYQECRKEFYDAFNQMTAMRGQPVDLTSTDISKQGADTVDVNANRFMLFFGTAGAKLTTTTEKSLDQIAQLIKQRQPKLIRIEGHSDAAGGKKLKQKISDQRAIAVSEALIQRGVNPKLLQTKGWSDRKPLFKTKNKNVPANRRAEIWLDF